MLTSVCIVVTICYISGLGGGMRSTEYRFGIDTDASSDDVMLWASDSRQ